MAVPEFGVGVDIEAISRFKKTDDSFLNKVFTRAELDYCLSQASPAQHLAARFAGKEAIIKALGNLKRAGPDYREIEITNDSSGAPSARILRPGFADLEIKISMAHSKSEAVAMAVVTQMPGPNRPLLC